MSAKGSACCYDLEFAINFFSCRTCKKLQIALNCKSRLELRTNLKAPLYCTSATAVAPIC